MFFERIPRLTSGSLFATRTLSDWRDARYFSADDGTHCYVRGAIWAPPSGFTPQVSKVGLVPAWYTMIFVSGVKAGQPR